MPLISKFKMKILLGWCIFSVLKSCLFICFLSTVSISNFNDNVLVLLQASHFVARWKSWRGKVLATKTSGKTFLGGRSICPMVGHKKANGERVIIHKFKIRIYIQWKMAHFQFYALSRNNRFSICIRSRSDHFLALSKPYGLCWDMKDLTLGFRYTCSILEEPHVLDVLMMILMLLLLLRYESSTFIL